MLPFCSAYLSGQTLQLGIDLAMATSTVLPLNPEPSQPGDRRAGGLPPKSYADAIQGRLPESNTTSNHVNQQAALSTLEKDSRDSLDANEATQKKIHRRTGSLRANGIHNEIATLYGNGVLERQYSESDGGHLTSSKVTRDYEAALRRDEIERPRSKPDKSKPLVSGRKAGAGWENSA